MFLTSSCVMSVPQVCGPQFEQRRFKAPMQGLCLRRGRLNLESGDQGVHHFVLFPLHHLHASLNPWFHNTGHTPSSAPCHHLASRSSFFLWVPHLQHLQPLHSALGSSTYTFQDFLPFNWPVSCFSSFRAQWLRSYPPHRL